MTRIARAEWLTVALIILLVTLITSAPYLLAAAQSGRISPNGVPARFGGFLIGGEDGSSYLGKMRLGARGESVFTLFYTSEIHQGEALTVTPYLLAGAVTGAIAGTDDSLRLTDALIVTFHTMRVIFGGLMIAAMYAFIARLVKSRWARAFALVLAITGGGIAPLVAPDGGFGWLGDAPPEFYIPEGFSWLILLSLPHVALARAALLAGLVLVIDAHGQERRAMIRVFAAGACWIVVGLCVPFYLAVIYAVLGAWGLAAWIARRRFPLRLLIVAAGGALITLPLFAYNLIIYARNPVYAAWSAQNVLNSPHPFHYLLAYAVLGGLAAFGVPTAWRRARVGGIAFALPIGWIAIAPILVYLPINVQRRLSEAVIVPLAALAALGTARLSASLRGRLPEPIRRVGRVRALFLFLGASSTALLWVSMIGSALSVRPPVFVDDDRRAAFAWLDTHAAPDDVVLSPVATGNLIPAYADVRVFAGHGPETIDWPTKNEQVRRFFADAMPADARTVLFDPPPPAPAVVWTGFALLPIRWIVDDGTAARGEPIEPTAGGDWRADPRVSLAYETGSVRVYRVDTPP